VIVAFGASLGAVLGSGVAERLILPLGLDQLLLVSAALLLAALGITALVERRQRPESSGVEQEDRLALTLFTDEDVLAVGDDALARRLVLFNQPGLLHTGPPQGQAEA
jgi:hypothetical protein